MSVLNELNPNRVFYYFEKIASIPHGSRNTKMISDYLVDFAKEHSLEYYQDELNNVIIIKEATKGYEDSDTIIIQGHMYMVCEKENDCDIDFNNDGLSLYVDGDFVKAKGTTLGGDDGIAVAYALAILESDEYEHPRLEVILTVDEEIGMLGAYDIDLSMLKGKKMLNIDSDVEGEFLTSCAGGLSMDIAIPVNRAKQEGLKIQLKVGGLSGGHSGSEIHKEHGNANILMGRLLDEIFAASPLGISQLFGGLKDNAIPRECVASIVVPKENKEVVEKIVSNMNDIYKNEFHISDSEVFVEADYIGETEESVIDFSSVNKVIFFLRTVPNGVMNMSMDIPNLVETSLNLGIMNLNEDALNVVISVRSSVSSRKIDVSNRVIGIVQMLGGEVGIDGEYPAWEYKPESELRNQIEEVYERLFGKKPVFNAIHAGLECGIISEKIPNLDCVSFGPTNYDIHTPKERLSISSTQRVWEFIIEYLKCAK